VGEGARSRFALLLALLERRLDAHALAGLGGHEVGHAHDRVALPGPRDDRGEDRVRPLRGLQRELALGGGVRAGDDPAVGQPQRPHGDAAVLGQLGARELAGHGRLPGRVGGRRGEREQEHDREAEPLHPGEPTPPRGASTWPLDQ
jgi:hypothetical protein